MKKKTSLGAQISKFGKRSKEPLSEQALPATGPQTNFKRRRCCSPAQMISLQCNDPNRLPLIEVRIFDNMYQALIDTGSQVNCISEELFENLSTRHSLPQLPATGMFFRSAVGQSTSRIRKRVTLPIFIENVKINFECFVVPKLIMSLFFGAEFLTSHNCIVDYKNQHLKIFNKKNNL